MLLLLLYIHYAGKKFTFPRSVALFSRIHSPRRKFVERDTVGCLRRRLCEDRRACPNRAIVHSPSQLLRGQAGAGEAEGHEGCKERSGVPPEASPCQSLVTVIVVKTESERKLGRLT